MKVQIVNNSGFPLPEYAKPGDAGIDLRASFKNGIKENFLHFAEWDTVGKYLIVFSGGRALIPTNIFIKLPEGYELQIRPRSGLALKQGITILNTPGTIDSSYTGEVGIIIQNLSDSAFIIENGDRICQAVLNKFEKIDWESVDSLVETERGTSGFGDSGKK
jgi:dUTP pyrophosphatase